MLNDHVPKSVLETIDEEMDLLQFASNTDAYCVCVDGIDVVVQVTILSGRSEATPHCLVNRGAEVVDEAPHEGCPLNCWHLLCHADIPALHCISLMKSHVLNMCICWHVLQPKE